MWLTRALGVVDPSFTAWTYRRLPDGDYLWTDPYANTYRVTPGH